jgi:hypothetical protein
MLQITFINIFILNSRYKLLFYNNVLKIVIKILGGKQAAPIPSVTE